MYPAVRDLLYPNVEFARVRDNLDPKDVAQEKVASLNPIQDRRLNRQVREREVWKSWGNEPPIDALWMLHQKEAERAKMSAQDPNNDHRLSAANDAVVPVATAIVAPSEHAPASCSNASSCAIAQPVAMVIAKPPPLTSTLSQTTPPSAASKRRSQKPLPARFAEDEYRYAHPMACQAKFPLRVPTEECLAQVPQDHPLRVDLTERKKWWTGVFLGEETIVRVPWSFEFDAEARCSRQEGTETDDMFVGRLRFTGILFLKDGLDANGDGAPDGRGPLHKNGEVVQTSDGGWKISKFGDLPCYYEGDLDLGDCSMAGGNGGFYVGYEAREVYSGPFSPDCVTLGNDSARSGAKKYSSLAFLYGMYGLHHNMLIRSWQPVDKATTHVEIRRAIGGDESLCCEYDGNRLHDGSSVLVDLRGTLGDRTFAVPPGVLKWIAAPQREVAPWLGDLAGRPRSVVEAVGDVDGEGVVVQLVRHSVWISFEACYTLGGQIHFRKDANEGRNQVLYLAYGKYDVVPTKVRSQTYGCHGNGVYPWDVFMQFHNVEAVLYSPIEFNPGHKEEGHDIGPPFVGNHAQCLVYFADRTGGDYDECLPVFPGRPVAVPMQWVSSRFGDQWDHALKCPNMPVIVSPRRDRFPVMSPRVAYLLDMELLLQLHKEDIATSVKRRLTSRTPPVSRGSAQACSGVAVPGESSVSLLWGVLQREFIYGIMPVTHQLLSLGLGDMSSLHEGGQLSTFGDTLWQEVPHSNAVKRFELPNLVTKELEPPKLIQSDQYGGENNRFCALADAPVGLVRKTLKTCDNLRELKYIPYSQSGNPFVATFDLGKYTRTRNVDEQRVGYTTEDFLMPYAVSAAWVRQYYHILVVQMAIRQVWDPQRFQKAMAGGFPQLRSGPSAKACVVPSTQPETWPYLTPMRLHGVGSAPGSILAGCARGAFAAVLRSYAVVDPGAVQSVFGWSPWVQWSDIGRLTSNLNAESWYQRTYRVRSFKQPGSLGDREPRNVFHLLTSPLGRRQLYAAGIDRVVLRPVYASGWQNHMVAVVADEDGQWSLLDPADGGASVTATVLHGSIPHVEKVVAAFAVSAQAKKVPGTGTTLFPVENRGLDVRAAKRTRKGVVVDFPSLRPHESSGGKKVFHFPVAPTTEEAKADFYSAHLHTALSECLIQMGYPALPLVPIRPLPANHDATAYQTTQQAWEHLVSHVELTPLECNQLQIKRLESLPDKTPGYAAADTRTSMWGKVRGGANTGVTFYLVEGTPRFSVAGSTVVVLVLVSATRHQYYCPRNHVYKSVTTPAAMGFVGRVTEYYIDHWGPEKYNAAWCNKHGF